MRICSTWCMWAAVVLLAGCLGCGDGENSADPDGKTPVTKNGPDGGNKPTQPPEPAPPKTIPEVKLTQKELATCKVLVGQNMPQGTLADTDGSQHALVDLYGEKLTVLCLFSGAGPFGPMKAEAMLGNLQSDYAQAYADKGLKVVGINRGDTAEVVSQLVQDSGATFPVLLDPDGAFFDQVAKEKLPRIYLLDGDGKILWFDIEFSDFTKQDLRVGVQVALGEIQ